MKAKTLTKRDFFLAQAKFIGYHGGSITKLRIEAAGRVSYEKLADAYRSGKEAKAAGVRCNCTKCREEAEHEAAVRG